MAADHGMLGAGAPDLKVVFTEAQINERLDGMALEINSFYGSHPVLAVCVLKGAFMFFSDLVRRLDNPNLELDFIRLSSYGMNSESSRQVKFIKDIETDISARHVLIVEDIVDSGHTMRFLMDQFGRRKPLSLKIAALIDKHERREAEITADFYGFRLSKGFLVGYGLDYAERFRELPYIGEMISG